MNEQLTLFGDNAEYDAFVEKWIAWELSDREREIVSRLNHD